MEEYIKKINIENHTSETDLKSNGIYLIYHEKTTLKYVGATFTKNGFRGRWVKHLNGLKRDIGNRVLLNIYKKYDIQGFRFCILEKISEKNKIPDRELFWINLLDTYNNGCNVSIDTKYSLKNFKRLPITEEHKKKLMESSPYKKKVYLYDFDGNLIRIFKSSCECDRFFKLKKGSTSEIISNRNNRKAIHKKYVPKYEFIEKTSWDFSYGMTKESLKRMGEKHKNKIISKEQRNKTRLSNKASIKVALLYCSDDKFFKMFNSLNECDDFLNLTRGATSKVLKGKAKTLKDRMYYPKIIN